MQIRFEPPPQIDSSLSQLDARWRLAGFILALATVASLRSLSASLTGLLFAMLLVALAQTPWAWLTSRVIPLLVVVSVLVLPLPFLSTESWAAGFHLAGLILLKAMALFHLTSALLVSGRLESMFAASSALGIPKLLTHLALLTLRYLFLLGEELARMRIALRVRGFRNRANWHSYHTVANATGMLLVRGNARATRVSQAMRCRGFDGHFRTLEVRRTHSADIAFVLVILLVSVALIVLDIQLLALESVT